MVRTFVVVFAAGLFSLAFDAALEREWPDHGLGWWAVFLVGLLLIGVLADVAERWHARRVAARGDEPT